MIDARDPAVPPSPLRLVSAGGLELQVIDRGQGLPVVFLHGFPLDHSMWNAELEPISKLYRAIAPDLRGFGGSKLSTGAATPAAVTMEQMADDVAALLDALEVREPIVLCGLSMGGYVAFEFWRKYASRLRGLVLCDTRAMPDTAEAAKGRYELAEKVLQEGAAPVADVMVPKLFAPASLKERSNLTAIQRDLILKTSPEGIAAALRGMAVRSDFRPQLANIAVPTLVIVGEHDEISTVDEMRSIAAGVPGSKFVVIPQAGHMSPLEEPDAFLAALVPFLEQVEHTS
jgi:pimeloyl-ACP methyl ester carboxylesterase